jgi:hypothetical protein
MGCPGILLILGDNCPSECSLADEEDMPELTLTLQSGQISGFEMNQKCE